MCRNCWTVVICRTTIRTNTTTATARFGHRNGNIQLRFSESTLHLRPIPSLLCAHRFQSSVAEYVDDLRRILALQLHLSNHDFVECAVLNLLGGQRDPDLAPVIAAAF